MKKAFHLTHQLRRKAWKQAVLWTDRLLVRTYSFPSPRTADRWTSRLARARAWFRARVSLPNYPLYQYAGRMAGAGSAAITKLQALVWVDGHSRVYIPWLLYGSASPDAQVHPLTVRDGLEQEIRQRQDAVDLIVLALHSAAPAAPLEGDWLRIPDSIRMVMDFAPQARWEDVQKQLHRSQRSNLGLVQRGKYRYERSASQADFDYFIQRMYRPMVATRHADHASLADDDWLREQFAHGYVGKVIDGDGNWVSGELGRDDGPVHFGLVTGVLDGRADLLRRGAIAAVYVCMIRNCVDQGQRRLDSGPGIPFAEDGVIRHKQRWGFHAIRDPWTRMDWLFWSPGSTPAARAWFQAHPTIPSVTRTGGPGWAESRTGVPAARRNA